MPLADDYFALGETSAAALHWRVAREWYQKSVDSHKQMRQRGSIAPSELKKMQVAEDGLKNSTAKLAAFK